MLVGDSTESPTSFNLLILGRQALLDPKLGCSRPNVAEGVGSRKCEGVIAPVVCIVRSIVRARDVSTEREVSAGVDSKCSIHYISTLTIRDGVRTT